MQRAAARVVRLSSDPELALAACDFLDILGLSPERRMAAEDRCPVHKRDGNFVFWRTLMVITDMMCEKRGQRPPSELITEQITAGAEPYQMQEAGRA